MAKPIKKPAKPAKKSSDTGTKRTSLAALYDEADESEASNFIGEGSHEVRLNRFEYKKDPVKGEAVFAHYDGLEGDIEGKTGRQMYKLTDGDGAKAPGIVYLKRDLKILGYSEISGRTLLKTLKEISEEQPMVVITGKQNGQYMNYYLQGPVGETGLEDDADADAEESEEKEFSAGDKVTWNDGDSHGEILKINLKKETAKVVDSDGDEETVDLADLELDTQDHDAGSEGESEEEPEIVVGSRVKGEDEDGEEIEGKVTKVKGDIITVEDDEGDKHKCDVDDLTIVEEEEEEEEAEEEEEEDKPLEVGDRVSWTDGDGDELEGVIKKIKGERVTVEDDEDDIHKVELDDLTKVNED